MNLKELYPAALILQTDGGVDHSIKRLATKLAMVAFFVVSGVDHSVVLRCAPNGSALNKVDRNEGLMNWFNGMAYEIRSLTFQ